MTNKIVILQNSVELYEHYINDEKWERTLSFPKGGLTYLISNGTIKFYAYEDYLYRNCLMSMQLPIYIVDEKDGIDGEYSNIGEIVDILDEIFPTNDIDAELEGYLTKREAELTYQPIGDYVTTDELDEVLEDYYTKDEVDDMLDEKADADDVYTKDEVDGLLDDKADKDDVYTKQEADDRFQPKGDYVSADTFTAYTAETAAELSGKADADDVYTKPEVDDLLDDKLDATAYTPCDLSNYYTKQETSSKTQIDTALARKVDNDKVYTKNESDSKYQVKLVAGDNITISGNVISASGGGGGTVDAYTKAESDARYQPKGDYATEAWVLNKKYITSSSTVFNNYYTTANTYNKTEVNNIITNIQNQISALTEALNECCSGTPTPTTQYRWVTMTGEDDYVCNGYDEYSKQKKQVSTDGGETWADVSPEEYRQGTLIESDSVKCGYTPPTQASGDYLTFYALEDVAFLFEGRNGNTVQYSLDSGSTWATLSANTATPTITSGNTVLWKGELIPSTNVSSGVGIGKFSSTGRFNLGGNPMSLLFGDNFRGQTSLSGKDYAFTSLFSGCSGLINAERLALPATTLSLECYAHMFSGCINLTKVSENLLPATALTNYCYQRMFRSCYSLTTVLELPALTLSKACYSGMFQYCSNLPQAPVLNARTLVTYCYAEMFNACSKLNYIKCLATNISAEGCTSLWISGVAKSGTFVKASSISNWHICNTSSYDGIPCNWTIQDA